ncbi:unnamed protein product [Prunus brigantina]
MDICSRGANYAFLIVLYGYGSLRSNMGEALEDTLGETKQLILLRTNFIGPSCEEMWRDTYKDAGLATWPRVVVRTRGFILLCQSHGHRGKTLAWISLLAFRRRNKDLIQSW